MAEKVIITNEEKAKEVANKHMPFCGVPITECIAACQEMAKWKEQQLDKAIDKALEHHSNKLKEGKITQYGMDNVFAFVQNIRTLLNSEL